MMMIYNLPNYDLYMLVGMMGFNFLRAMHLFFEQQLTSNISIAHKILFFHPSNFGVDCKKDEYHFLSHLE